MKILLVTNILTPYRKCYYDAIYNESIDSGFIFKVLVLAKSEPNRNWVYDELCTNYTELLSGDSLTINDAYIHFNFGFKKYLEKMNPDIVIVSGAYFQPVVVESIFWKDKFKYKLLFWSESHLKEKKTIGSFKIKIREFIRKNIYKRFDGFWYAGKLSLDFINKYSRLNHSYKNIFVPNLIEECYFQNNIRSNNKMLKGALSLDTEKFTFVFPARLSKVKGILEFLYLFNKYKNKDKIEIIILGDGELRDEIQSYINKQKLNVLLAGYQSMENMSRYYEAADCFLLPSLSDPNPLSCIEALWSGLPLLVSNHVGNYPEVVQHGKNGYIFDYDEPDILYEYIDNLLLADSSWKEEAFKLSKKIAIESYSCKNSVKRIMVETMEILND